MKTKAELATKSGSLLQVFAVGFALGVIACGTIVFLWPHDSAARSNSIANYRMDETIASSPPAPMVSGSMAGMPGMTSSTAPILDPAVARVAVRFDCSCGTADCGAKRLDVCRCDIADKERVFIRDQLRAGHSEDDAAKALNQSYGGLKS